MKKSLIQIIGANIAYLLLVAGTNFLLPMFTSVDTYATIKEYTLYVTTYSGILTVGYVQGMYLRYGGYEISEIDPKKLGANVCSFFFFMLVISMVFSIFGLLTSNPIITVAGAGIMASNYANYYQLLYQATGDFKSYGIALNASRVVSLLSYVLLIFVFRTDQAMFYICVSPLIELAISIYLTYKLNKRIPVLAYFRFSFSEVKSSIRNGFILMLGNFVTNFFSSIDKWFVKYLLETFHFAMYSFAVSMERLVNTFMTPVTVSMYNYLCKSTDVSSVRRIKNCTLIYSLIIIAAAFPAKWILENFMQQYISSISVLFYLFAAQAVSTIIRGIYVNKYKAEGEQNKYLKQMIGILILSVVLNSLFYYVARNMAAIALATLITNVIWLTICEIENPKLRYDWKAILSLAILLVVYIYAGYTFDSIIGCLIYCATGIVLGLTLMRESFIYVLQSVVDTVKGKLKG